MLCLFLSKDVDAVKLAFAGVMKKLDGMLPGIAAAKIGESCNVIKAGVSVSPGSSSLTEMS